MELYTQTSYELSKRLTLNYSTSFSKSTQLFPSSIQKHIFAIYGLVRIADEIVDTYAGKDSATLLDELEAETYRAIKTGYSTNPIVHSFAISAKEFDITATLIKPFFESMRMDLTPITFTQAKYKKYIHGSAEVIGLMCLKIFCAGNSKQYDQLVPGAQALGSAYQKVNFLRDIASDYKDRGRVYFPGVSFETFNDEIKMRLVEDIQKEFITASIYIQDLPESARKAVSLSYEYYLRLLNTIEKTSAETLKTTRVRVSNTVKTRLLITQSFGFKNKKGRG